MFLQNRIHQQNRHRADTVIAIRNDMSDTRFTISPVWKFMSHPRLVLNRLTMMSCSGIRYSLRM